METKYWTFFEFKLTKNIKYRFNIGNNTGKNLVTNIQLVREIKAYLKSLGTSAEPYYKAIVKLQFKDTKP